MPQPPAVIVIGLGNPIRGDDGVGWRVAEYVQAALPTLGRGRIDLDCVALGGLSLMERLVGYDQAVVIDATETGRPAGTVERYDLEALPGRASVNAAAPHDMSLPAALQLGRALGARLPQTVIVIGVEAERLYEFSEELTPAVAAAVPRAAELVLATLRALRAAAPEAHP